MKSLWFLLLVGSVNALEITNGGCPVVAQRLVEVAAVREQVSEETILVAYSKGLAKCLSEPGCVVKDQKNADELLEVTKYVYEHNIPPEEVYGEVLQACLKSTSGKVS